VDGDNLSQWSFHIIDGVLIPSWVFNSLTDRVFANDDLSTLLLSLHVGRNRFVCTFALTVVGRRSTFADTATLDFLTSTEGLADLTAILHSTIIFRYLTSSILVDQFVQTTLEAAWSL
jgi:hypothetical protein